MSRLQPSIESVADGQTRFPFPSTLSERVFVSTAPGGQCPLAEFRSSSEGTANLHCQGRAINNEAIKSMQLSSLTGEEYTGG